MKRLSIIVAFLLAMTLMMSCGKELPEGMNNYVVSKGGSAGTDNNPSVPDLNGIPSENDNPLPSY